MNVYVIESFSPLLLDDEINKIVKNKENKVVMNAETSEIDTILREASYVSMFEEMKYLVIKNANYFANEKLSEPVETSLLNYLEKPYPKCTVIFTTYEHVDLRKKITKIVKENYKLIIIPPLKALDLYLKVNTLLIEKSYKAEKDVINYIISSSLNNYDIIYNEIKKIDLYYNKPTKLELESVKKIVSKSINDNNFKFIDAVMAKDIKKSFQFFDDLLITKTEPISLISLLAREFRMMLMVKTLTQKKYSAQTIQKEMKLMDWQLDKILKNSHRYHELDLKDYLISLEKLDYKIKTGQIDKVVGLQVFLIDFFEY